MKVQIIEHTKQNVFTEMLETTLKTYEGSYVAHYDVNVISSSSPIDGIAHDAMVYTAIIECPEEGE